MSLKEILTRLSDLHKTKMRDKNMIATAQFRIYVACLAAYNDGYLHGRWIDIDGKDKEEVQAEITEMLKASPVAEECEEWAIHDHEGFKGLNVSESNDLEEICDYAQCVENSTYDADLIAHVLGERGCSPQEALEFLDDNYLGEYRGLDYWIEEFLEETGGLENVPKHLLSYFDYNGYARDMELNGEIMSFESPKGVHVLWWN